METSYYTTPWPSDLCYEDILPTYVETLSISQWTLYYLYTSSQWTLYYLYTISQWTLYYLYTISQWTRYYLYTSSQWTLYYLYTSSQWTLYYLYTISQWTLYYLYVETLSQIEHFTTCMIIIDKPLFTVILKIYYTGNGAEIRMVLGVALHLLGDSILPMPRSYNATFIQCHFYTMPPLYNATFIQYISFNIYLKVDFFT